MSLSYSWNDNIVKEMGDPVFDNYGLVTIREGYPKYSLWGQNVVGAVIDTFDLALLGMQGSVPFFDPVNGYQLEEEGFLGRLVPEHTGNFSVNVDYKILIFSCCLRGRPVLKQLLEDVVGNRTK